MNDRRKEGEERRDGERGKEGREEVVWLVGWLLDWSVGWLVHVSVCWLGRAHAEHIRMYPCSSVTRKYCNHDCATSNYVIQNCMAIGSNNNSANDGLRSS